VITQFTIDMVKLSMGQQQPAANPLGSAMMPGISAGSPLGEVTSQGDTFHMGTANATAPLGMMTPKRMPMSRAQPLSQQMGTPPMPKSNPLSQPMNLPPMKPVGE